MTPKQEAAIRQALERIDNAIDEPNNTMSDAKALKEIIRQLRLSQTALREALAEQTPKKFDPNESFRKEEANLARVREFMRSH